MYCQADIVNALVPGICCARVCPYSPRDSVIDVTFLSVVASLCAQKYSVRSRESSWELHKREDERVCACETVVFRCHTQNLGAHRRMDRGNAAIRARAKSNTRGDRCWVMMRTEDRIAG